MISLQICDRMSSEAKWGNGQLININNNLLVRNTTHITIASRLGPTPPAITILPRTSLVNYAWPNQEAATWLDRQNKSRCRRLVCTLLVEQSLSTLTCRYVHCNQGSLSQPKLDCNFGSLYSLILTTMQVMSWILTSSVCSIALVLCLVGKYFFLVSNNLRLPSIFSQHFSHVIS